MFGFVYAFCVSCMSQFAQYYQLLQDNCESLRLRDKLHPNVKAQLLSPISGKLRIGRARALLKQTRADSIDSLAAKRVVHEQFTRGTDSFERLVREGKIPQANVGQLDRTYEHACDDDIDVRIFELTTGQVNIDDMINNLATPANPRGVGRSESSGGARAQPARRPSRKWTEVETNLWKVVRGKLKAKLADRPQYPEAIGDRKLIRFIRGHEDDIERVCRKVENYLDWRTENKVDEIRRNIVEGGINSVAKFPHAMKILKLAPALVYDAKAVSLTGEPVIAEGMIPVEMWETVSLEEYMLFRLYCLEFLSLVLEQISRDMEKKTKLRNDGLSYGVVQQIQVIRDVNNINWSSFMGTSQVLNF